MKNLQSCLLLMLLLCSSGCGLSRGRMALAGHPSQFRHGAPTPRVQVDVPPIRVELPESATQPKTIVNVYDKEVEASGPAQVIHHPNGMEVIPSPSRSRQPPSVQANPPNDDLFDKRDRNGGDSIDWKFWGWVIGATGLMLMVLSLYRFRTQFRIVARDADLSDGISDEVKQFIELMLADVRGEEPDEPAPEEPPPPEEKRAVKKPAAKRRRTTTKKTT